jgi:hypothetical protein
MRPEIECPTIERELVITQLEEARFLAGSTPYLHQLIT